ncbi:hypothetical protein NW755_013008 [Fusarium falciforme]|uniref:CoA-binding domain-containing protein n=1 Tax=Fusarium falciforme TaxID=195108 RepID=A0A9W8QU41_9HYPO|nr:hypothetical protein NW755_013008 [Fusarium falciforme]KAJ4231821.1 hypothetical protein NW757_013899 [Fusarium falciforme]
MAPQITQVTRRVVSSPLSCSRAFSSYHIANGGYEATIGNLNINRDTKVIYQGFTGKAATKNAQDTIEYGTNIVGGVSPGKGGQEHLGLPIFNTVREAMQEVKPFATSVFVPAQFAAGAIIEAIEAEVPLVVSVAEHVPIHDMIRVHQVLRTQNKTRLVGANCPGIIAPEQCRIGIMPHKQYSKGSIGIVSKSGTLSYEAVGTTLVDGLKLFFEHPDTEGIVVIGEIGGEAELRAAEVIREYRKNTPHPKPIIAMVADAKVKALEDSGAVVVQHPGVIGKTMRRLLGR